MTNTTIPTTDDTIVAEGAWHGRAVANSLRQVQPSTEEEAYKINALVLIDGTESSLLWERCKVLAAKHGWTEGQRLAAHAAAVDAYYDRMTGVD